MTAVAVLAAFIAGLAVGIVLVRRSSSESVASQQSSADDGEHAF